MEEPREGAEAAAGPISSRRVRLFVAAVAAYYAVYYVVFSHRVAEYFRDLLRHFSFFRRLF